MRIVRTFLGIAVCVTACSRAGAQSERAGTAFTYQGQLIQNGIPLTGPVDFRFTLWDAEDGGSWNGPGIFRPEVIVDHGLFSVELDFGNWGLLGDKSWLEIEMRTPAWDGVGTEPDFVVMRPRQRVTAAPFATYGNQAPWSGLLGVPSDIADGDNDTQLSEAQVEGYIANGPIDLAAGTTMAGVPLAVESSGDGYSLDAADGDPVDAIYVDNEGRVGIGTTVPMNTLSVDGTVKILSHPASYSLMVEGLTRFYDSVSIGTGSLPGLLSAKLRVDGGGIGLSHGQGVFSENASGDFLGAGFGTNSDNLDLLAGGISRVRIMTDGRVGIGTLAPSEGHLLDVNGRIHSRSGGFAFPDNTVLTTAYPLWKKWVDHTYYDVGRVGIGVSNPAYPLTVDGTICSLSGGFKFPDASELKTATGANMWTKSGLETYYCSECTVGIGTDSPQDKLELSGGLLTLDSGADGSITGIRIRENDTMRWTILYRTWQDDDLEILNEKLGSAAMVFKADNKVGIGTSEPSYPLEVGTDSTNGNKAHVTAGGVWVNASDRHSKEDFEGIDTRMILAKLADLPVMRWRYKGEAEGTRHLGPVAQDFYEAFGLGESDRHITTLDAEGVALAAIQGLHNMVQEKDAEIAALRAESAALRARLEALEATVRKAGVLPGNRHH
jgi:hypothetical protein